MAAPRETFEAILGFMLPKRCLGCDVIIDHQAWLCSHCWQNLTFLTAQGCSKCGIPLPATIEVCAPCLAKKPSHDGAQAAVAYQGLGREIVIKYKHGRKIGMARYMAAQMHRHVGDRQALLIPVPLHRWRIWRRGYNQSALLARELAKSTGLTCKLDWLQRHKKTPTLAGLGAVDRQKALRGAFSVPQKWRSLIRNANVILVDDVYTSGATANACALALKRAGAAQVHVLCWARVLLDEQSGN